MALEQIKLDFAGEVPGVLDALPEPFGHKPGLDFFQGEPTAELPFLSPQLCPPFILEAPALFPEIFRVLEETGDRQGKGEDEKNAKGYSNYDLSYRFGPVSSNAFLREPGLA